MATTTPPAIMSDSTYTANGIREKPLAWLEGEIRTPPFSREARLEAGELLGRLQRGYSIEFPHARPMPAIGPGCLELRVKDRNVNWRIIVHLARDYVVIMDVFAKKTTRTPHAAIANCRRRLANFLGAASIHRRTQS